MVTIGMNYQVIEGKNQFFENAFKGVLKAMHEIEGHEKSNLYCDTEDKNSYLIVSEWSSQEAFDGFIASDKFKNVANWGKEQILAGRPRHQVYKS